MHRGGKKRRHRDAPSMKQGLGQGKPRGERGEATVRAHAWRGGRRRATTVTAEAGASLYSQ